MSRDFIKAAIIGHPVSHSKSPLIHNYWLKKYGLNGIYEAIDVTPDELPALLHRMARENYAGFNVTLPHKLAVMHLCDGVDALAKSIGAVNLVTLEDGRLMGSNSDAFGFVAAIKQQQPRFNFKKGAAAVLGAGGAARAIAHGLLDEGVPELYIFNRTKTNAESVAAGSEAGRIKILNWDERETALASVNIVVNTTSLGMDGQPALDMSLGALNKNALVADIVYKPLKTSLIRDAEARGNPAVPGIGMLLHQARPAFQAWFGIMPEIDETLEKLVSA